MINIILVLLVIISIVRSQSIYEGLDVIPSTNLDNNNNNKKTAKVTNSNSNRSSNPSNVANLIKSINDRMASEDRLFKMNDNYYNTVNNRINNMVMESTYKIEKLRNKTLESLNYENSKLKTQVEYAQQKLLSVFENIGRSEVKVQAVKASAIFSSLTDKYTGKLSATSLEDVLNRFSVTKNLQEQIVSQANSQVPQEQIAGFVKMLRPELTQAHINDIILATAIANDAVVPKSQSMAKSFADQQLSQKIQFQKKKAELEAKQNELMSKSRTLK
jgi:hypothetical protein